MPSSTAARARGRQAAVEVDDVRLQAPDGPAKIASTSP
jgi:hypothetical protein